MWFREDIWQELQRALLFKKPFLGSSNKFETTKKVYADIKQKNILMHSKSFHSKPADVNSRVMLSKK